MGKRQQPVTLESGLTLLWHCQDRCKYHCGICAANDRRRSSDYTTGLAIIFSVCTVSRLIVVDFVS